MHEELIQLAQQLSDLRDKREEIQEHIEATLEDIYGTIRELEDRQGQIHEEIQEHLANAEEAEPDSFADLRNTEADMKATETAIKQTVYSLPVDEIQKGLKVHIGSTKIVVSKPSIAARYDVNGLLEKFPEIEDMTIEGDPIIIKEVDESLMARAVDSGRIDEALIDEFRIIVKAKNPAVRISEEQEKEDE